MIFKAFSILFSGPIHKKAILEMNHKNCSGHHTSNAECGDPRQETNDQTECAEELSRDHQYCKGQWDTHGLSEKNQGAVKTMTAEPTKDFLRTVRKKTMPSMTRITSGATSS
jgi:hypothetical protein